MDCAVRHHGRIHLAIPEDLRRFRCGTPGQHGGGVSLGNLLYCYWYVALLLICLWPIATKGIVVALWPAPENAVARWSWYLITWLASVVLMAFIVVIILVPLLSLVSALSK